MCVCVCVVSSINLVRQIYDSSKKESDSSFGRAAPGGSAGRFLHQRRKRLGVCVPLASIGIKAYPCWRAP